jgi:hypothetical protein
LIGKVGSVRGLPNGITACLLDFAGLRSFPEPRGFLEPAEPAPHAEAPRQHGADVVVRDLIEPLERR